MPLLEVFEYIADAGYIAYSEQIAQLNEVATKTCKAKENFYKKFKLQEKKFNDNGKLIGKETIYTLLFPKLSALD